MPSRRAAIFFPVSLPASLASATAPMIWWPIGPYPSARSAAARNHNRITIVAEKRTQVAGEEFIASFFLKQSRPVTPLAFQKHRRDRRKRSHVLERVAVHDQQCRFLALLHRS